MTAAPATLSPLQIWILAARPKTLPAAITPVVIGAAIAWSDQAFHLPAILAALIGAVLIQIGTNFANDFFDFEKAVDTHERLGPLRVTHAGLVTPRRMRTATAITFGLALTVGMYLVARGGWPIVGIGLASILLGILYTGGPYPLGYNGLADIFVLIFFGPVAVGGTYYVSALTVTQDALLAGIAPGLLSVAILVVNNTRDLPTDRSAGKKTLAVRFGRTFSVVQYAVVVVLALLFPVIYSVLTGRHLFATVATLALIPAIPLIRSLATQEGRELNHTLAGTGRLLALYGFLFAIGWMIRI